SLDVTARERVRAETMGRRSTAAQSGRRLSTKIVRELSTAVLCEPVLQLSAAVLRHALLFVRVFATLLCESLCLFVRLPDVRLWLPRVSAALSTQSGSCRNLVEVSRDHFPHFLQQEEKSL